MDTAYRREWDRWGDFLRDIADAPPPPDATSSHREESGLWAGTRTWGEAVTLARNGWPDGYRRVARLADALIVNLGAALVVQRWDYADDGRGGLDIARAVEGEPECWLYPAERRVPAPVHVVYNATASAGVNANVLEARGAVACALIETLETSGRPVDVTAVWRTAHKIDCRVRVKRAGEPLDRDRLVFALANPAAYRRLGFAAWEQAPSAYRRAAGVRDGAGYGYVSEIPEDERKAPGVIYFGGAEWGDNRWDNPDSARQAIVAMLRAQGVEVRPA